MLSLSALPVLLVGKAHPRALVAKAAIADLDVKVATTAVHVATNQTTYIL